VQSLLEMLVHTVEIEVSSKSFRTFYPKTCFLYLSDVINKHEPNHSSLLYFLTANYKRNTDASPIFCKHTHLMCGFL